VFEDVAVKIKKKNKILFNWDSKCLEALVQLVQKQSRRTLVLWALDCSSVTLALFESKYPMELRPRVCLERCEAWSKGTIKMPEAKKAILASHAVAKEIDDGAYIALCHAIGHAGATGHVKTHAMGLVFYELTALVILCDYKDYSDTIRDKISFYYDTLIYWQNNTELSN